jgi:hypothetical protein
MRYSSLLILIFLPALAFAAAGQETKDLELSAGGINTLLIQSGAGYLNLNGIGNLNEIEVTANILVEGLNTEDLRSFLENNLLLDLKKKGKNAVLRAVFLRSSRFRPSEAKIDLFVRVPKRMNVKIDDRSGPIHASGFTGNLEVYDGSGSIAIRDIMGRVRIWDASGPVKVETIIGNVDVRDGSGSIDINFIKGDVNVTDTSGSITIQDVEGHVKVLDGSGSVDIHDISKNVSILESYSGEISIEGVKGKITRRDMNAPDEEIDTNDDVE